MGTEYYLVKPDKKEIFYLGKHKNCPDGIVNRTYKEEADYIDYDCFDDFFWDFLRENYETFYDFTLESVKEIIYEIYLWCNNKIYWDSDCREGIEWSDWKETGSLIDIFERVNVIEDINATCRSKRVNIQEEDLAKFLFDGDSEKAKILLELIHEGAVDKIEPILDDLEMNLEE